MKWKVATASVVTAAFLSAPAANAAPANGNGNDGPGNVGQTISAIVGLASGGATPGSIIDAVKQARSVLGQLRSGKRHGNGKGVDARQAAEATKANIGKTLPKPAGAAKTDAS